jgi:hypothetical protein
MARPSGLSALPTPGESLLGAICDYVDRFGNAGGEALRLEPFGACPPGGLIRSCHVFRQSPSL